jgi:hypothetical protein
MVRVYVVNEKFADSPRLVAQGEDVPITVLTAIGTTLKRKLIVQVTDSGAECELEIVAGKVKCVGVFYDLRNSSTRGEARSGYGLGRTSPRNDRSGLRVVSPRGRNEGCK